MTILYENDNIIVKKDDDNGRIYAGYKGETLYPVHGGITEDEFDGSDWILTYSKGTELAANFRKERGSSSGLWIEDEWFKSMGDGRYVSDDEFTMYEALLEKVDDEGEYRYGFLMGFQGEA